VRIAKYEVLAPAVDDAPSSRALKNPAHRIEIRTDGTKQWNAGIACATPMVEYQGELGSLTRSVQPYHANALTDI
jgi:hypothetical protein